MERATDLIQKQQIALFTYVHENTVTYRYKVLWEEA